jgi:hypothetical protein
LGVEAVIDEEADIGPERLLVDRQSRLIGERGGDRHIAAFEPPS